MAKRKRSTTSATSNSATGDATASKQPVEPTPTEDRGSEAATEQLCQRVRHLRKKRGWTLEQLASLSGVSRSMLSQIENGTANPTLGVTFRVAQAFGMNIGDLVDVGPSPSRIDIIRRDDETYRFRDDEHCRIRTLSPLHLEKDVEFYEVMLHAGGNLESAPHFSGTREFLTVASGSIRLVSGGETCELQQGDSAHYPADQPHSIENTGDAPAVVFLVDIYGREL